VRWENDDFGGTDWNYTNGIGFGLTRPGPGPLGEVWNLAGAPAGRPFNTWELTQLQFTPADLSRTDPDPADRPYAGVLYLGLASHFQREESLLSAKLILGVVGPASLAEGTQRLTHQFLNDPHPRGWHKQVRTEPLLDLLFAYRHRYRLTPPEGVFGIDVVPMGMAMLGNYLTQVQAGVQCRIGFHLPDDFGVTDLRGTGFLPSARDGRRWSGYLFAGGGASLVARDITLDGNTFSSGRSVKKRPLVSKGEVGVVVRTPWCRVSFGYQIRGREFAGQRQKEDFGSLLLSFPL
jgi:lipid A 3-O-deacylase